MVLSVRPTRLYYRALNFRTTYLSRKGLLLSSIAFLVFPILASSMRVVVVGGGIQGTSVAYHLAPKHDVTILEAVGPASAASGKGGGFMARSWGDGGPTQRLHELAFDMYESMAKELSCETFRKLPVLSVTPGYTGVDKAKKDKTLKDLMPSWLDGKNVGRIRPMGYGDDTAQITPSEFVSKMLEDCPSIQQVSGSCIGFETDPAPQGRRKVTGVIYSTSDETHMILPADAVVVSAGPWSCQAEDWIQRASGVSIKLPMEGVKSASIVWEPQDDVDATALFCGEDDRFGTHLEVYPRPDGTIYICGIGGSDYVQTNDLKRSAFLEDCPPNMDRVEAAKLSFRDMASTYETIGLAKQQACMRPCPPDALPYMGRLEGCDGAFINAGHNCWGIAWAPACGKAMAELVATGESSCLDLAPFDPSRFTSQAERRGRKKKGVDVGEQW